MRALTFLDHLDPESLQKPSIFPKATDPASESEDYALRRCKALLYSNQFARCIEFADSQLKMFPRKIGKYDVWIAYYRCKALASSGQHKQAVEQLRLLVKIKSEWYIEHLIAENEFLQKNLEEAWSSCVRAAVMPESPSLKVKVFALMARVLEAEGKQDEAMRHLQLYMALQRELGRKIREETRGLASRLGLAVDGKPALTSSQYLSQLRPFWRAEMDRKTNRITGQIKTLMGEDAGFVCSEDGQEFYFKTSQFVGPRSALQPGSRVTFCLVDSFDRSKGKASQRAEQIRLA